MRGDRDRRATATATIGVGAETACRPASIADGRSRWPAARSPWGGSAARRSCGAPAGCSRARRSGGRRRSSVDRRARRRPGRRASSEADRIGQRGGQAGLDRVRGDGDPDLPRRRRARPEDLDQGGSAGDAEDQPEGQEGELARGHAPLSSSAAGSGQTYDPSASVAARRAAVNSRRAWPTDAAPDGVPSAATASRSARGPSRASLRRPTRGW